MKESNLREEIIEYRPRLGDVDERYIESEFSNVEDLKVIEYEEDDTTVAYLESEVLEGLVGHTDAEVLSEVDYHYGTAFTATDFSTFEYANGWALLRREE